MSELVKLAPGALAVGQALPWTVYDQAGSLLVRKGYVVHSERQLDQLYQRGLYHSDRAAEEDSFAEQQPAPVRVSPFVAYPRLLQELETALRAILKGDQSGKSRIQVLADRIDALCTADPDACLALVHNSTNEPSAYDQTLFHAILCRMTAVRLDLDRQRVALLLVASLTANIALLPYLDKLNGSRKKLNAAQRAVIGKHPLLSSAAVVKAGFSDEALVRTIEQHHEQCDGSGYPGGLTGKDIILEARILALAERYTSMISLRAYRRRTQADRAMVEILAASTRDMDKSACHALVRELTPYPPGVIVRLSSGELGVVTHRPIANEAPVVQAIVSPKGNPYMSASFRDCDEHRIEAIVLPENLPTLDMDELWGH